MKNACEGVLYPKDAMCAVKKAMEKKAGTQGAQTEPHGEQNRKCERDPQGKHFNEGPITVPHKAWVKCKDELDGIFLKLAAKTTGESGETPKQSPKRIFVLAPLHKGPIIGQPFSVYTPHGGTLSGTDWNIGLETPREILELGFVEENDDICTEEHSLEVIAPYLAYIYPNAPVCYLLAPCEDGKICELKQTIGHFRQDSLIFVSDDDNTHCASMWL